MYRKLTPTSKTFAGQPLYSPEVSFGNLVFVSGKGGGVDAKGDITAQTTTVLDQIEEDPLKLAGSSMDRVLKVNVYLTDMKNFEGMNKAYLNRFGPEPPVRTTVAVVALRPLAGRDRLHRASLMLASSSCRLPASQQFEQAHKALTGHGSWPLEIDWSIRFQ